MVMAVSILDKPNKDYRFYYQITPNIVFYQSQKGKKRITSEIIINTLKKL